MVGNSILSNHGLIWLLVHKTGSSFLIHTTNLSSSSTRFTNKIMITAQVSLSAYTPSSNFCRRQEVKKKLFVIMVILNVTLSDYSSFGALGRYECLAFAVGNPVGR